MQEAYNDGLVVQPRPGAVPRFKRYLDEQRGLPLGDVWTDIPPINSQAKERLGYPTQKPEALLERIIQASSNEGDVVMDPFCGCGTAVAAAQKLGRQWMGIDITHLAVALMKNRLKTAFDLEPGRDYQVVGEPADVGSARALWEQDPFQFQVLGRVPAGGPAPVGATSGSRPGHRWASLLHRRPPPHQPQDRGSGQGRSSVVAPGPGPQGGGGEGKCGLGTIYQPGHSHPGHARRGGQRRVVPLRYLAEGLPEDTNPHSCRVVGRQGLRDSAAPAHVSSCSASPTC